MTDKDATQSVSHDDSSGNNGNKRPLTLDGERPQKKFYRQHAHCNPLAHNDTFDYPIRPQDYDWSVTHYPTLQAKLAAAASIAASTADAANTTTTTSFSLQPTILDVGCGFGGLTMALGTLFPDQIILGMEIRVKVTEYVRLRIIAARQQHDTHHNCSVMRTNAMKFLPRYIAKHSLHKLFFCFPDPHFKRKNHPRRIVATRLLSEYAYLLKPGTGRLYCITDVKELHEWHVRECNAHALFERIPDEQVLADDVCVKAMIEKTEEGQKVTRNKGSKYFCVYQRI